MPKGVYQHKTNQGFQKGHSIWTGRKLTEEHKAKLRKPKSKPSHFKGRTYKDIYGDGWEEQLERRRLSRIAYHDAKGRSVLFRRPHHWGWAYSRFTRLVFERDHFTCVICGNKGTLHADHYPESFSSICKRLGIKTMGDAMECKELWDTANGRTLCEKCHRKTHSYGKHEFTEETRKKIGEANKNRKRKERFACCHPDRKHFCKSLCRQCYGKQYRERKGRKLRVERPLRYSVCHPGVKHFCKGLCRSCYQKWYRHGRRENEEKVETKEKSVQTL